MVDITKYQAWKLVVAVRCTCIIWSTFALGLHAAKQNILRLWSCKLDIHTDYSLWIFQQSTLVKYCSRAFKSRGSYGNSALFLQRSQYSTYFYTPMAPGEVGLSLPWWCHALVLPPLGYRGHFFNLIFFS